MRFRLKSPSHCPSKISSSGLSISLTPRLKKFSGKLFVSFEIIYNTSNFFFCKHDRNSFFMFGVYYVAKIIRLNVFYMAKIKERGGKSLKFWNFTSSVSLISYLMLLSRSSTVNFLTREFFLYSSNLLRFTYPFII